MRAFVLCIFCFCWGCTNVPPSPLEEWLQPDSKVKVLSTTAMIDNVVSAIGGDRISHLVLIQGEADPHSYELVKGDEEKFSLASLVLCNGLGLEHGASLHAKLHHHPNTLAVGNYLRETHGDAILLHRGQVDPHVWMDIALWSEIIDPIVLQLTRLDPEGKETYITNGKRLKEEMLQVDASLKEKLLQVPAEKRYLVTSHDAFSYFTKRYLSPDGTDWQTRFQAPEGLAPESQLSCQDIQALIDHLCRYRIEVVFAESNVSSDSLHKIVSAARQKGLDVHLAKTVLYADAIGPKGSDADTYLKMLQHNTQGLLDEWSK